MQQRFTGKWSDRVLALLLAAIGVALPVGWLLGVTPTAARPDLGWALFSFILVVAIGIESMAIATVIESCAVFVVDDDAITKTSLLGAMSMPWNRVVRITMSDPRKGNIVLTDDAGRRLCIRQSLASAPEALVQIVMERLAALSAKSAGGA